MEGGAKMMMDDLAVAVDVLAGRVAALTAQIGAALADAHASRESLAVVSGERDALLKERDALRDDLADARRDIAALYATGPTWEQVQQAMVSAGVLGIALHSHGEWSVGVKNGGGIGDTLSDAVRAAQP
jgi:hypothetical protein